MRGGHILGHAAELGDPRIMEVLGNHTDTFEAHIQTYFNGQEPDHYSVKGPMMAGNSRGVGQNYTSHPTQVGRSGLDAVLVKHLDLICPQLKEADISDYQKGAEEGYQKPFSIRYIIKVNGFKKQKRAVRVPLEQAELVRRHVSAANEGDLAFQVRQGTVVPEPIYHNTIVVTHWVHIPLVRDKMVKWTFGTAYVSDNFPHHKPTILNRLNGLLKRPETVSQVTPADLTPLIDGGGLVYALLPPLPEEANISLLTKEDLLANVDEDELWTLVSRFGKGIYNIEDFLEDKGGEGEEMNLDGNALVDVLLHELLHDKTAEEVDQILRDELDPETDSDDDY